MHDYLQQILQETAAYVEKLESDHAINRQIAPRSSNKSFAKQLRNNLPSLIAEVKRRSPSKGRLSAIKDPVKLVEDYVTGGADAISVLTNFGGFGGSIADLKKITGYLQHSATAVLRKDFIIHPLQIQEAVLAGADAVLLIVTISKQQTATLLDVCQQLNIDALVEVHDHAELEYALSMGAEIIGINNRNLTNFKVDTNIALKLVESIPKQVIKVAESGIHSLKQVKNYIEAGFDALLIGESLVKSENSASFIREIKQCRH